MTERERLSGRIRNLERRAEMLRAVRQFFDSRGFVEIEAPIRVPSPGVELHIQAFGVDDWYLSTSPEYQMKRLLAGGMERIYSLGKVFRRGEVGPHHNSEFTMLEWYRAHAGWEAVADDVEALVAEVAGVALTWERLTVAEACRRHAGVEVAGDETADALRAKVRAAGFRAPDDGGWDDVFFTLFLDAVEPKLGPATILYDWPRPLAALARRKPGDDRVVERFEAYVSGVELCNAFGELTDPVEQRWRCEKDLKERERRGLPAYPLDEQFLAALAEMPPSAGVALGVDRLAMILVGARHIRDVLPFADDEL